MEEELGLDAMHPSGSSIPEITYEALGWLGGIHDIPEAGARGLNIVQGAEDRNVVHIESQSSFAAAADVHDLAAFELLESLGLPDKRRRSGTQHIVIEDRLIKMRCQGVWLNAVRFRRSLRSVAGLA